MKVGGLFSGIGGFELGLSRAGFEISWMVEIDEFCRKVLKKHAPEYWPNARILEDVTKVGKEQLAAVDLICGGFPCQPFSQAGKRRGKEDDRYLWPEMLRIIRELKPRWIIGENVAGFINMELENAFTDLEAEGYKVEAFVLPANAVELPHRRERVWIVAHPSKMGCNSSDKIISEIDRQEIKKSSLSFIDMDGLSSYICKDTMSPIVQSRNGIREIRPEINRNNDGVSSELDRSRIGALGNAVVPQIPEILGRCILEIENDLLKDNA